MILMFSCLGGMLNKSASERKKDAADAAGGGYVFQYLHYFLSLSKNKICIQYSFFKVKKY